MSDVSMHLTFNYDKDIRLAASLDGITRSNPSIAVGQHKQGLPAYRVCLGRGHLLAHPWLETVSNNPLGTGLKFTQKHMYQHL